MTVSSLVVFREVLGECWGLHLGLGVSWEKPRGGWEAMFDAGEVGVAAAVQRAC